MPRARKSSPFPGGAVRSRGCPAQRGNTAPGTSSPWGGQAPREQSPRNFPLLQPKRPLPASPWAGDRAAALTKPRCWPSLRRPAPPTARSPGSPAQPLSAAPAARERERVISHEFSTEAATEESAAGSLPARGKLWEALVTLAGAQALPKGGCRLALPPAPSPTLALAVLLTLSQQATREPRKLQGATRRSIGVSAPTAVLPTRAR